MRVVSASDAPVIDMKDGIRFTVAAAPSLGSPELCLWRTAVAPGHQGGEPHTIDQDEVFLVLSGSIELTGRKLGPGDSAIVPAGEPIALANPGEIPAVVCVAIKAGFTGTLADGTTVQPPWAQ